MRDPIVIDGVPFLAVSPHDGRFFRAGGLFALARRDPDGGYTVLHLELSAGINRHAGPGHERWGWAVGEGLNTLLIHLAESRVDRAGVQAMTPAIRWHPQAWALGSEDPANSGPAVPPRPQHDLDAARDDRAAEGLG